MAKQAKKSFTITAGGRTYAIGTEKIYADTNPVVLANADMFDDVAERAGTTLATPVPVAGTPAATTCDVTWANVSGADFYTVTTSPATVIRVVTAEAVSLTGLTTATEYDVIVVAGAHNPEVADSAAGEDTFTTA